MNKKFLSAVLFGALMVTSTGTFVSCKDYDDDIENLQGQINSNKDAIAALQKLVGEGKWVTAISPVSDGFSITMSDGTTQTVTGIKGADGKDGTEWTIGEDGFWYKDGEKTANKAVAEDGITAPSPKINADGMWVVYEWDATKGEFVEKVTEIPAQGTSAYVVKKDGVFVLHIADETGAFQDVTLPATSDSFVAEAPYAHVQVMYETAVWNKWNANKAESKTLLKKYPELAEIAKNAPMQQGGNLPILITPANVELTDGFSFSLQDLKGKTADIEVSNPVKGLPANMKVIQDNVYKLQTRSAADNCFWTVKVKPAYDEKTKVYETVKDASLSVTNAKGTLVKTAFAYEVKCDEVTDPVSVTNTNTAADYAASIDVFTAQKEGVNPIFTVANDYAGKFVLELTNNLQVEKYQLSVDESKIVIGNMPANETSIKIDVKVTVLGLNGSVASTTATITVSQGVDASDSLKPQAITLSKDPVKVRWNMDELGMSAVQLDQLMSGNVEFFIGRTAEDEEADDFYYAFNGAVKFYNDKNAEVGYSNGKWYVINTTTGSLTSTESSAVTFGLDVDADAAKPTGGDVTHNGETYVSEMWMPKEYTVTMTSKDGTSVIFSAETTLTISNPAESATATYIKMVPAFVENNVFQITGKYNDASGKVIYSLKESLILGENATLKGFVDLDAFNYIENGGDETDVTNAANYNWLDVNQSTLVGGEPKVEVEDVNATLYVNKWEKATSAKPAAKVNQLYKERTIRAFYYLFNNPNNVIPFDYKVKVKSEIFSEKPADVVVMDIEKLVAVFTAEDASKIDIQAAITKTLIAAGTDKGKEYDLYATVGGKKKYNDYAAGPKQDANNEYVVTSTGKPIAIKADDLMDMGMTMEQYIAYSAEETKPVYYLKMVTTYYYNGTAYATKAKAEEVAGEGNAAKVVEIKGWNDFLYVTYDTYYNLNADKGVYDFDATGTGLESADKISETDKTTISLFNAYNLSTVFTQKESNLTQGAADPDARLGGNVPVIAFANPAEATKYFKNVTTNGIVSGTTIQAVESAPSDVTGGKVVVPMKISIKDAWGMTMVRTFDVTVYTAAPEE